MVQRMLKNLKGTSQQWRDRRHLLLPRCFEPTTDKFIPRARQRVAASSARLLGLHDIALLDVVDYHLASIRRLDLCLVVTSVDVGTGKTFQAPHSFKEISEA